MAGVTLREEPQRTLSFAGDEPTGAELRRLWPALAGSPPVANLEWGDIASLSWESAKDKLAALMVVPETGSWSRSRHRRSTGPQPLRDHNWPWGLPWISPRDREIVEAHNEALRDHFKLMSAWIQRSPSAHVLLLHPEDLGPADNGHPASIWQLPELRLWANRWGLKRYCTHQCVFGKTKWPFPLGLLSTHPLPHRWFRPGWPRFDKTSGKYVGPLPKRCNCPPGTHARDDDYKGRTLRERPDSIIQPGLLEFASSLMLGLPQRSSKDAELSRRGTGLPLVRDGEAQEGDTLSGDSTDAEEAELNTEGLLGPQRSAVSAGQPSWDILALRALGIQDLANVTGSGSFHPAESEGVKSIGAEARVQGSTGTGLQQMTETLAKPDDAPKDMGITEHLDTGEQEKKNLVGGTEVKPQKKLSSKKKNA